MLRYPLLLGYFANLDYLDHYRPLAHYLAHLDLYFAALLGLVFLLFGLLALIVWNEILTLQIPLIKAG